MVNRKAQQIAKKGYLRAFLTLQMPSESRLKPAKPREWLRELC